MIRVQQEDFDPAAEIARVTGGRTDIGAVVTFTGLVRAEDDNTGPADVVTSMTLDHYPAMTEAQLRTIDDEARRRWRLKDTLIIHRYGHLLPGARIVLVVVCSVHRRDAFDAAAFLVDWLKTRAPFWKREETARGGGWVAATAEDSAAARRWDRTDAPDGKISD